jgi:hypothetical protein
MALLGKERAASLTPNTTTVRTSGIAAQVSILVKIPAPEIAKPEPFYRSR